MAAAAATAGSAPVRTTPCTPAVLEGRRRKAKGFMQAAEVVEALAEPDDVDTTDALVTLWVHAGIAAADVICCTRLGEHARGESHDEAVRHLERVDRELAKRLEQLLGVKTLAGYSARTPSQDRVKRASRAAQALVGAMDEMA